MDRIKLGTDGWHGMIAGSFTVTNVARLTDAVALWLLNKYRETGVVIGYDTRFGGKLFAETTARVLAIRGVKVFLTDDFVTAPMVSYAVTWYRAGSGIMITAGQDSFEYSGYKLTGEYGGPMMEEDVRNIEALISNDLDIDLDRIKWHNLIDQKIIEYVNIASIYTERIKSYFDLDLLKKSGLRLAFDAMHGSSQHIIRNLLPGVKNLRCKTDPYFGHVPPEPTEENLKEFIEMIRSDGNFDCGLAIDGDGSHLALIDKTGNFIDPDLILLTIVHCLAKYRNLRGKVVAGYSSTSRLEKICKHYGLEVQRVKTGFKEISRIMLKEDVLAGGEESGGIAIRNHIPDRDGIWIGFLIWQFMAETRKSLDGLIGEVYSITGRFAGERKNIEIGRDQQSKIIENCSKGIYHSFKDYRIVRTEQFDGYKFLLEQEQWVMIKPYGSESKLRIYAESETKEQALSILQAVCDTIQNG
jgi:phosphomannomutase